MGTLNKKSFDLTVNFLAYWFIGTGSESGAYSDLLTLKDPKGFPYVPGKSLKGVFREAFRVAACSGWFDNLCTEEESGKRNEFMENLIQNVFGSDGTRDNIEELHAEGLIHFSNAELPSELRKTVSGSDQTNYLFSTVRSTAVDRDTGTADEKSLRTIEVALPMHLHSEVTFDIPESGRSGSVLSEQQFNELVDKFEAVAGLVTEMGGKRRRGFGRCLWDMKEILNDR